MKEQADSDSGARTKGVLGWCDRANLRAQVNIKWSRVTESGLSLFAVKCKENQCN